MPAAAATPASDLQHLRLRDLSGGVAMFDKLRDIGPGDKVNACASRRVVDRMGRDDDEEGI